MAPRLPNYETFLYTQASRFEHVLVIAGNHEFYGSTDVAVKDCIASLCAKKENLHFLDQGKCDISGFRFLGCTLWSNIPTEHASEIQRSLNDYVCIDTPSTTSLGKPINRRITPADTNRWHQSDRDWLSEEIKIAKEQNLPTVVLTHHAPLVTGTSPPEYEGGCTNAAFATDLSSMMGTPKAWLFGHTHYSSDQMVNGTRVLSNQRGYKSDSGTGFKPDLVVTVSDNELAP